MFKELRYELFRGLAYREIRHQHMGKYTTYLPLGLAALTLITYYLLPVRPPILGKDGLLAASLGLLSTLPGFYFAGLAAVATFGSSEMDKEMPAPAPVIKILTRGQFIDSKLTKRQFLSYLFSYLVLISFCLCLAMIFLNVTEGSINQVIGKLMTYGWGGHFVEFVKAIFLTIFSMTFGSLAITTLQGVFFLTEKIHQP